MVKVKCCEQAFQQFIRTKLIINQKYCQVERERAVKVIRCYNCQSLGHLARHCRNIRHCEYCDDSHTERDRCSRDVQCSNCSGKHPASSSKCPVYIIRYEIITKQYTECQHIYTASQALSPQIEC